MMSPFSWLPEWIFLCLLILAALYGVALLFMPFSVFGIKPKLREVELQLAELRAEIRALSLQLPRPMEARETHLPEVEVHPSVFSPPEEPLVKRRVDPLRPGRGYMDPPRHQSRSASYDDGPSLQEPEQILRPTRFEPPAPAREGGWPRAPWDNQRQGSQGSGNQGQVNPSPRNRERQAWDHQRHNGSREEELLPRGSDPDRLGYRPSRSEPMLRWPPRGE